MTQEQLEARKTKLVLDLHEAEAREEQLNDALVQTQNLILRIKGALTLVDEFLEVMKGNGLDKEPPSEPADV
jgi:uncharacterized coiled-coil protein SlyX